MNDGLSISAAATSSSTVSSSVGSPIGAHAVDDRVGRAKDTEQRPPAPAIVARAGNQARDLDELHEHAADPRQRRHRPERREGVIARLDLDLGQRLEQRRLAHVGRADERYLRRALAAHRDRVAMHRLRAHARVVDLGEQRLAQVRIRAVLVIGQLREQRANLADALATLFSDQSTLRQLGERPVWHRHDRLLFLAFMRDDATARTPLSVHDPRPRVCLAPSSDAVAEGAVQPFCLVLVTYQARSAGAPKGLVIARRRLAAAAARQARPRTRSMQPPEDAAHGSTPRRVVLVLVGDPRPQARESARPSRARTRRTTYGSLK